MQSFTFAGHSASQNIFQKKIITIMKSRSNCEINNYFLAMITAQETVEYASLSMKLGDENTH